MRLNQLTIFPSLDYIYRMYIVGKTQHRQFESHSALHNHRFDAFRGKFPGAYDCSQELIQFPQKIRLRSIIQEPSAPESPSASGDEQIRVVPVNEKPRRQRQQKSAIIRS